MLTHILVPARIPLAHAPVVCGRGRETRLFGLTITKLIRQKQNRSIIHNDMWHLVLLILLLVNLAVYYHCQVHILRMVVKLSQK